MITCVVTARPSYSRIQTALEALRGHSRPLRVLAVGAACHARYGQVSAQIRADGFDVMELPGLWDDHHPGGMVQMVGHLALGLGQELRALSPELVITIADRYETMATALAASYQHIPLCHIQGGEVTGNIDDKVRGAITQLADLHCVATTQAGVRVRTQGARGPVHITGCPSIDLALRTSDADVDLPGIGPDMDTRQPFLLVLHHPVTDEWQDAQAQTQALMDAVLDLGQPTVWFWPNVDAGAAGVEKVLRVAHEQGAPIRFVRQVPPADFIRLMRRCRLMAGNSSASIREGSAIGTPALVLGRRQTGRQCGPNVTHWDQVPTGALLGRLWDQPRPEPVNLYGDGQAGVRIAAAIDRFLRRAA